MNSYKNKLIAKNSIMLFVRMALITVVTLYTSRVLLRVLGTEDFGIYNVVGSLVLIFSSVSASINAASNRFLICELGKNDAEKMKKTFNSIFLFHLIAGFIVFFVIEAVGLYLFNVQMNIPLERADAAKWVFHFTAISVVFLFMSFPFNSLIIAHEKMGAFAAISIVDALLRLLVAYLMMLTPIDKLFSYGLLILVIQIVIQIFYVVYCKVNFPETVFMLSWDKKIWLNMSKFMTWIFLGNVAYVGYTQGVNLLLNVFFGPVVNASRAIAVQVQSALMKFVDNFQTAVRPQITISYVQNDLERLETLIDFGTRISFSLLSFVFVPLFFVLDIVLKMWLENVPPGTGSFIIVLMLVCSLRCLGMPLVFAIQAKGSIRSVQVMESICLIMVLPLSYIALKIFQISAIGVFIISLLAEFCCYVGKVIIIIPEIGLKSSFYMKKVVLPILLFIVLVFLPPLLFDFFAEVNKMVKNIISFGISFVMLFIVAYSVLLNSRERLAVCSYVKKVQRFFCYSFSKGDKNESIN